MRPLFIAIAMALFAAGCAKTDPVDDDAVAGGNLAADALAAPINAGATEAARQAALPQATGGDLEWSYSEQDGTALFGPPGSPAFSVQCQKPREGEAQLVFVRHIPPATGNTATLSFTGNGETASLSVSPVGNPGGLGGHWRGTLGPDDIARDIAETFDGSGPVEVSVSGTPPLIVPATDIPRRVFATCLAG